MKIYLSVSDLTPAQLQRIQEFTGDDNVCFRKNFENRRTPDANFLDSEVVFGNVPVEWLSLKHKVRWTQLVSVGFGEYRLLDWTKLSKQLTLTNLAGFFANPVAQTALAGILALYRGMDQLTELRIQNFWKGDPLRSELRSLFHKHVVLFGYGSINRTLEKLLDPFDCDIEVFQSTFAPADLDSALAKTDIVVCTVPETDYTVGLFNAHRLSLLKPGALFVNCGRGSTVDETALVALLNERTLGGAVIDVTIEEPLPSTHPFWTTPNTILSQHSGGGTEDELDRKIEVFAENLALYRDGLALKNKVDFEKGY